MISETEAIRPIHEASPETELLPSNALPVVPTLEPNEVLDAHHAFDDGVLAEVPYALDAYINHQCFGLC